MKTRMPSMILAGLLLASLGDWGVAAPLPPAGRPKEIASFQAHEYVVQDLAFSPDSKILASAGRDSHLKLWDAASGTNRADIRTHFPDERGGRGIVFSVAFSPDGKTIASGGDDRKVKLWDVVTGRNSDTLEVGPAPPLLFSPDGKTLICGYRQLDLATKKDRPLVEKIAGQWLLAAFDPNGKLLVATSFLWPNPPSFVLWDVETGKKVHTCKGRSRVVRPLAFSPDGKTVVSTEGDHDTNRWSIRLWDITTGKNTATWEQPDVPCWLVFSPNGKVLAVPSIPDARRNDYPGVIRLLEVSSGKVLATLKGHKRPIGRCLAFSPNGRLLASGSSDGIIKIWQLLRRYADEEAEKKAK